MRVFPKSFSELPIPNIYIQDHTIHIPVDSLKDLMKISVAGPHFSKSHPDSSLERLVILCLVILALVLLYTNLQRLCCHAISWLLAIFQSLSNEAHFRVMEKQFIHYKKKSGFSTELCMLAYCWHTLSQAHPNHWHVKWKYGGGREKHSGVESREKVRRRRGPVLRRRR